MEDIVEDPSEEYLPQRKIKNREHILQVSAVKFEDLKEITSSDQIGAFPIILAQGNRYVMVMENSDTGPILATIIKSIKKEHQLKGFIEIHNTLNKVGINPILHQINNEFLIKYKKLNQED